MDDEKEKVDNLVFEKQEQLFTNKTCSKDVLLHAIMFFEPKHYDEVVIERSSMLLCGYPLCGNNLTCTSGKQKLNVKERLVIKPEDDVNKFCSSTCQRESEKIKMQISFTSVYKRAIFKGQGIGASKEPPVKLLVKERRRPPLH